MPRRKGKTVRVEVDECCGGGWGKWKGYRGGPEKGVFGRALFIIGLLIALNALGMLHGVVTWVQVLIGVGFALMSF